MTPYGKNDIGDFAIYVRASVKSTDDGVGNLNSSTSSNVATCRVPTSLVDQSFTVAGPHLWNNRPLHLQDSVFTVPGE